MVVLSCLLSCIENFFSAVALRGVCVLSAEVLGHLPGRELSLTDVAKVPRQVDRLPLHQARKQGHVASLPPPSWQCQAQPVKLVTKLLSAIL